MTIGAASPPTPTGVVVVVVVVVVIPRQLPPSVPPAVRLTRRRRRSPSLAPLVVVVSPTSGSLNSGGSYFSFVFLCPYFLHSFFVALSIVSCLVSRQRHVGNRATVVVAIIRTDMVVVSILFLVFFAAAFGFSFRVIYLFNNVTMV